MSKSQLFIGLNKLAEKGPTAVLGSGRYLLSF